MCGIAGAMDVRPLPDPRGWAARAIRELAHRGPDGRDTHIAADGRAALAHTRLAVLGPDSSGAQPMVSVSGRYRIVHNGEIYNYRELRQELETQGHAFVTRTDTEVLLALYEKEGAFCLDRLEGMFAFAIWDAAEGTCFLARDPMGIKPLYYSIDGSRLAFASELKALTRAEGIGHQWCEEGLYGYLVSGSVPEPWTLNRRVRQLEAGSCLLWKNGRTDVRRYWRIRFDSDAHPKKLEDSVEAARAAAAESIRRHWVSDVPLAVLLSGGMDSAGIAAVAAGQTRARLKTICVTHPGHALDEGVAAARTAEHLGTDHTAYEMDGARSARWLEGYFEAQDQPSVDGFNVYTACRAVKENGYKVAVSGVGGDEWFGGYGSFDGVPRLAAWGRSAPRASRFADAAELRTAPWIQPRMRRAAGYILRKGGWAGAYQAYRGIFTHAEAARIMSGILDRDCASAADEILRQKFVDCDRLAADANVRNDRDRMTWMELSYYLRNQLLKDADTMSMASGIELRTPLVDRRLAEALAAIPPAVRIRPHKKFLAQMWGSSLPAGTELRPKRGFTMPFASWMEGEWKGLLGRGAPAGIAMDSWYRAWSWTALDRWRTRN